VFEAWKARKEVAPLLSKDFVLLYVDLSKVPGAVDLQKGYPKSLNQGIPWFVILDAEGKELVDSNGPKGNIGHPDTDEEIEVFTGILKKVAANLTESDRAALKKSLVDRREKK
jgi:hypothetical protein